MNPTVHVVRRLVHLLCAMLVLGSGIGGSAIAAEPVSASTNVTIISEVPTIVCPDTVTSASTLEVCAVLTQSCQLEPGVPLPGREVEFYVNTGSCGTGGTYFGSAVTDEDGVACLPVPTEIVYLPDFSYSIRIKFRGEEAPADGEPGNSACIPGASVALSSSNDCIESAYSESCDNGGFTVVDADTADVFFIHTVDVDRDNYTDIVYTGQSAAGLFVAYGTPEGTLTEPLNYLDIRSAAVDVAFVNGDTLLDIVAASVDYVYILYNEGYRSFSVDSTPIASAGSTRRGPSSFRQTAAGIVPSVVTGLFNDDPYVDVVVAPDQVWFGDGNGGFAAAVSLPLDFEAGGGCDFNRDGKVDLVLTSGDSTRIFLNDGTGGFTASTAVYTGEPSLIVPPVMATSDINRDRNCDFGLVLPLVDPVGQSLVTVALGDGAGGVASRSSFAIDGIAHSLTFADVNRDNMLDLVLVNGSTRQLLVYPGFGNGSFDTVITVNLGAGDGVTYALATLDLDRDGNSDFVTGTLNGGDIILAINDGGDSPILVDEMVVTGYSWLDISVTNPQGFVISEKFATVAGSDYQEVDINDDGLTDERTLDYNLQYGEYCITATMETGVPLGATFSVAIGIDGSQKLTLANEYSSSSGGGVSMETQVDPANDSIVICYTLEDESSVQPPSGYPVSRSRPVFDWSRLVDGIPDIQSYEFQLDRYLTFDSPIIDVDALAEPTIQAPFPLGNDSVFYWRIRFQDASGWSDYSSTYAAYITGLCCFQTIANVSGDIDGTVDISDINMMIEHLFITFEPLPTCAQMGDIDSTGWVDIGDLTLVIQYLFVTGTPLPFCP
ncbi:MAG: VCBS repeat-containing protein [candidate division Zixibacteria bacterium]|nr:VCBS repeat-containing protein [candidate division Zixibacteria bacterium]